MRQTLILLTFFVLLLSCNNADTTKVVGDTTAIRQQSARTKTKTERQILVEELKRLQTIFANNDKENVADLFSFPISNEIVGIYIDDNTFNAQMNNNGNKVTRAMFIRNYQDVSESLQINQVKQLFTKINVDDLLTKDTLEHEEIVKSEPCYHYYSIKVDKNLVTLCVGTNSNEDFKSKNVSADEIPENDSSICEHVLWWNFQFDGKELHFENISGAG